MAVTPKQAKQKHDAFESERLAKLMEEFKLLESGIDQMLIDSAGKGHQFRKIGAHFLEVAKGLYSPAWQITVFEYETSDQRGDNWTSKGLEFRPNPDSRIPGTLDYVEPLGGK